MILERLSYWKQDQCYTVLLTDYIACLLRLVWGDDVCTKLATTVLRHVLLLRRVVCDVLRHVTVLRHAVLLRRVVCDVVLRNVQCIASYYRVMCSVTSSIAL